MSYTPRTGRLLALVPPGLWQRLCGADLVIPYYHLVSDEIVPHVRHLYQYKSEKEFRHDLAYLLKHYTPITLADLLGSLAGRQTLPRRALLLTFDDGFREMSDTVAPLLRSLGVSAVFFVNTAFVDNRRMCYLNTASLLIDEMRRRRSAALEREVVRTLAGAGITADDAESGIRAVRYGSRGVLDRLVELVGIDIGAYLASRRPYLASDEIGGLARQGFGIGAHSVDHPLYAELSLDAQVRQTIESLREIRERFALSYGAFAFPHNDTAVSAEFFRRMHASGLLDVSFGTAGLLGDGAPRHFQRFSLERPRESAERLVAFQMARRIARQMTGDEIVTRS